VGSGWSESRSNLQADMETSRDRRPNRVDEEQMEARVRLSLGPEWLESGNFRPGPSRSGLSPLGDIG
jgi:hypothetical protein